MNRLQKSIELAYKLKRNELPYLHVKIKLSDKIETNVYKRNEYICRFKLLFRYIN